MAFKLGMTVDLCMGEKGCVSLDPVALWSTRKRVASMVFMVGDTQKGNHAIDGLDTSVWDNGGDV